MPDPNFGIRSISTSDQQQQQQIRRPSQQQQQQQQQQQLFRRGSFIISSVAGTGDQPLQVSDLHVDVVRSGEGGIIGTWDYYSKLFREKDTEGDGSNETDLEGQSSLLASPNTSQAFRTSGNTDDSAEKYTKSTVYKVRDIVVILALMVWDLVRRFASYFNPSPRSKLLSYSRILSWFSRQKLNPPSKNCIQAQLKMVFQAITRQRKIWNRSMTILAVMAFLITIWHVSKEATFGPTSPMHELLKPISKIKSYYMESERQSSFMDYEDSTGKFYSSMENLVIVAGHAIYVGNAFTLSDLKNESQWILEPFQTGQVGAFLAHIKAGVMAASSDPKAMLIFSGGETRQNAGPWSEALNYWKIADSQHWYGFRDQVRNRALTEEFSRDSLENLLFSICRFRELTQRYPTNVTMVSFSFKQKRFLNIHRAALRFPTSRFFYIGLDGEDPNEKPEFLSKVTELSNAANIFINDPYGCKSKILVDKKRQRNPFKRYVPFPNGCPEISALFSWCHSEVYTGSLPW